MDGNEPKIRDYKYITKKYVPLKHKLSITLHQHV